LDEQLTELEKLQQAAQLIEEMSQGRLLVRPSVAGLVYIRPQEDSNLGMDMRINSIPAIALPSPCSFAGWGPIWTRTVSGPC